MRRCVGCMESKPKNELIRVACYEGEVTVDPSGRAKGRGVYLCKDAKCMDLAKKKRALQRNFEVEIAAEQLDRVFQELKEHEQESN